MHYSTCEGGAATATEHRRPPTFNGIPARRHDTHISDVSFDVVDGRVPDSRFADTSRKLASQSARSRCQAINHKHTCNAPRVDNQPSRLTAGAGADADTHTTCPNADTESGSAPVRLFPPRVKYLQAFHKDVTDAHTSTPRRGKVTARHSCCLLRWRILGDSPDTGRHP